MKRFLKTFYSRILILMTALSVLLSSSDSLWAQMQNTAFWRNRNSAPTVNFTAASQTVLELNGVAAPWSTNYTAWTRQAKLTIDNSSIAQALTDLPVMVVLNSSRVTYSDFNAGGSDIRFESSGGVALSYEIEKWDASGTSVIWVKIPSIGASTTATFYMYYGNTGATDAQAAAAVWSDGYKAVYHFNSCGTDSLGVHAGTCNSTSNVSGKIGGGVSLSGSPGSNIVVPHHTDFDFGTGDFTLSAWIYRTNPRIKESIMDDADGTNGGIRFIVSDSGTSTLKLIRGTAFTDGSDSSANLSGAGAWQQVAVRLVAGVAYYYIDGVARGSGAVSGASINTPNSLYIGERGWAGSSVTNFTGTMDQLEISAGSYSAGRMAANYRSQIDGYIQYGQPTSKTSATVTVTAQVSVIQGVAVTVPFTVTGTAASPADHTAASGSITIAAGQTTGTTTFLLLRDNLTEGDESIIFTMGSPTNAVAGGTAVHTVTITDDPNVAPVANADNVTLTSLSATAISVLANDTDANFDAISISSITQGTYGAVVNNGNTVTYTPTANFAGTDTFTYLASDGRGGTATGTVTVTMNIPFTWLGAGVNANWSTAANWSGGVVPGAGNIVYFNNQCTTFCNPTVDTNVSVAGVAISSSYTGTVDMLTFSLTVGASGILQYGGTWRGGSNTNAISGPISITGGGVYRATAGTTTASGNLTLAAANNFQHNSGVWSQNSQGQIITLPTATNVQFYDLILSAPAATLNITFTLTAVWDVLHTLTIGPANTEFYGLQGGTMNVYGDINSLTVGGRGRTLIRVVGTGSQTLTGNGAGHLPSIEIAKPSGTFYLVGTTYIDGNFTYTSGTVDAGTSTIRFRSQDQAQPIHNFNNLSLFNVIYSGVNQHYNLSGSTLNVLGTLTLANNGYQVNNGTIKAYGDVTVTSSTWGSVLIKVMGSTNQTITSSAGLSIPNFEVASTGGTVTYSGTLNFNGNFTQTSGTVNTGTSTVVFRGANGTTTTIIPGAVSYNNVSIVGDYGSTQSLSSGTLTVLGSLAISDADTGVINSGTILAYGNIAFTGNGLSGSAIVRVAGSTNQTVTGTSPAVTPNFEIASTGGTVTLAGTLTVPSYLLTSGTVDSGTSTLIISGPSFGSGNITPGSATYNNVTWSGYSTTYALTGTMTVAGVLVMGTSNACTLNTGTIDAKGSVAFGGSGYNGTGLVRISGASSQAVTGIVGAQTPNLEIASTGGTVTMAGTYAVTGNYTMTSGTVDASASTLNFSTATATRNFLPGAVTYNNIIFSGWNPVFKVDGDLNASGNVTLDINPSVSVWVYMNGHNLAVTGTITNSGTGVLHRGSSPPTTCGTVTAGTYVGSASVCP